MALGAGERAAMVRINMSSSAEDNSMCADCLKLTKAMQKTSETFQTVADLYEDHVSSSVSF